jgi:hypothetical protein
MPIFRYTEQPGNYYAYLIEGHGDDANDGLTPETAVATLDRLVEILDTYAGASRRHAVIVKRRIYNEGITYARTSTNPITFEFVGGCEIDGSGASVFRLGVIGDRCVNATIKAYTDTYLTQRNYTTDNVPSVSYYFDNCFFVGNGSGLHYTIASAIYPGYNYGAYSFNQCLILNNTLIIRNRGGIGTFWANNSVFVNTKSENAQSYQNVIIGNNNIFYNNPELQLRLSGSNLNTLIDYSCIFGNLHDKDNAGWQALGQNLNGISANPQFTDPTNGQYTVNQSSPCLYRGEGGEHIGIGEGFYLQANILYFQQAAINNFQLTTGRLGFIDPLDNAFIETNPIDIGQIITLESAELAAILPVVAGEFTAGPVSYSHWYPAYSAASTYHKGAGVTDSAILYRSLVDDNLNNTPASSATEWERLTWESGVSYAAGKIVQYTDDKWYKANTATSTSWVAGEWDEVVMIRDWNLQVKTGRTYDECEAADWATIPYNTTPYLDVAGKGNSDDDYNPATGAIMVFRFIAVRIDAKTIV